MVISSCGTHALLPCSMWSLLHGIEPLFPALESGFLTTGPPGKSLSLIFFPLSFKTGLLNAKSIYSLSSQISLLFKPQKLVTLFSQPEKWLLSFLSLQSALKLQGSSQGRNSKLYCKDINANGN